MPAERMRSENQVNVTSHKRKYPNSRAVTVRTGTGHKVLVNFIMGSDGVLVIDVTENKGSTAVRFRNALNETRIGRTNARVLDESETDR